jgi:cytidylate kinase
MKRKIITLAGSLGSGKTSTANGVAKELGYERFSAGAFQRAAAESLGLPYEEYQKVAEQDRSYDRRADDAQIAAGKIDNRVIDSRLGYYFIPDSFKVFLYLDPKIAAERILKDAAVNPERHKELAGGANDAESIERGIRERLESEKKRYSEFYGIPDLYDSKYFDCYIDTSKYPLDKVIRMVVAQYQAWLATT